MKEYITEAIVLSRMPLREEDFVASLFTKDLGRIEARVVSGRKILSKLSSNVDFLNHVDVRIVSKNKMILADVVTKSVFPKLKRHPSRLATALRAAHLINSLLPRELSERRLWHEFARMLQRGIINMPIILKILGYDPKGAVCLGCGRNTISHFYLVDQIFLCASCSVNPAHNSRDVILI